MTAAKAMNESSVVSIDYNLKALGDIILTLENVQIFNGDGYYVLEDFTSVPMNIELDDFNGDSFETEYYKYYKASTKISGRALVYGVDKINQEKLLTSSTLQRSVVFLLLSILVYLIIKRVEK